MVKTADLQVDGLDKIEDMFNRLDKHGAKTAARKAVNLGGTPFLQAARSNVPVDTGTLKRALKKKNVSYPKDGVFASMVGADKSHAEQHNGQKKRPSNYLHLVEDGHIAKDGSFVEGEHFINKAFNQTKNLSMSIAIKKLLDEIERESNK